MCKSHFKAKYMFTLQVVKDHQCMCDDISLLFIVLFYFWSFSPCRFHATASSPTRSTTPCSSTSRTSMWVFYFLGLLKFVVVLVCQFSFLRIVNFLLEKFQADAFVECPLKRLLCVKFLFIFAYFKMPFHSQLCILFCFLWVLNLQQFSPRSCSGLRKEPEFTAQLLGSHLALEFVLSGNFQWTGTRQI